MKIEINNRRKTYSVQEEFNNFFINLKMVFYENPQNADLPSSFKLIKDNRKLADCRRTHHVGTLTISPSMTVGELKQVLMDVFGLTIDIIQKSGINSWNGYGANSEAILGELNKSKFFITAL